MGGGTKLAIGILVMWLAMLFFFFAFHPGGVNLEQDNPVGMLQWLMSEFSNLIGGADTTVSMPVSGPIGSPTNIAPTPTGTVTGNEGLVGE